MRTEKVLSYVLLVKNKCMYKNLELRMKVKLTLAKIFLTSVSFFPCKNLELRMKERLTLAKVLKVRTHF